MIGFAVSLKSIGKRVDSSTLLLAFLSRFIRLNIKLVLESINFSSKSKLSFLFRNFLFFFVPQQILDLFVLIPNDPVKFVDFSNESFYLVIMSRKNAGGLLLLKIPVLDFNVDNFRSIQLF